MPLDGHGHLVAQGWGGSGSGLRSGSISKPIIIAQKKNLAGVGKDRDEAFPFWDHVFNAAVGAIQIKIAASDSEDSDASDSENNTANFQLKRTSTGILSNRRPPSGISADSGATTPSGSDDASPTPTNLMALAKREAARKGLYARFFRGPVIGPDSNETLVVTDVKVDVKGKGKANVDVQEDVVTTTKACPVEVKSSKKDKKRKRSEDKDQAGSATPHDEEAKADNGTQKKKKKRPKDGAETTTRNTAATVAESEETDDDASHDPTSERQLRKAQRILEKEARRQRKADRAEKRAKKEERAARKAAKVKS
ncbi:hypothetical protein BDV98DRAFT_655999 [Pterulicium gracile]|uniref:G-patch domain-containing protein n=1 Tax=Pterulicium gracile TaxID=1884261 RepID=A0A5C3QIW7_9AGAR|nr:hypothetical protein BDV98DRAFT_655999 [Pterula gracilis]